MALIDTLKSSLQKWLSPDRELGHSVSNSYWSSLYQAYKSSDYENAYPYIHLMASTFASQQHYMVDKNGEKTEGDEASGSANLLARTYYPNDDMSDYDFREAMAIQALVHPIALWRVHGNEVVRGGKKYIPAKNIKGFTPLFDVQIIRQDGQITYQLPNNGGILERHQVWVDKEFNPEHMNAGFTPLVAAHKWIKLDDYIADYQAGYFENGAVPAGQFVITAGSITEFNNVVDTLQERHRGASKNNNVTYVHRPTSSNVSGAPAQIEWVSFSSGNKDLALKDLFEQTDKRIKQKFRIAPSLVGDSENNNLSSAQLDRKNFAETVMKPFTIKRWTRFNMNMNRITGGFGGAFGADVEIPAISEELKFKAEEKNINAQTVTTLVTQGFTAESAIEYVDTGDIRKLVEKPEPEAETVIPDTEEIKDAPDLPIDEQHQVSKELTPEDRNVYEKRLYGAVLARMTAQIDKAEELIISKEISVEKPLDEAEDELLTEAMLGVLLAAMLTQGKIERSHQVELLFTSGIDASDTEPFKLTGAQEAEYRKYIKTIATSYNDQTAEKIRNILTVGNEQGLSVGEMKRQMRGLLTEDWRIDRLARTEVHLSSTKSAQYSMQSIAKELNIIIEKRWTTNSSQPCEYCQGFASKGWVTLETSWAGIGDTVVGVNGGIMQNDWRNIKEACLHANCACTEEYQRRI